GFDISKRTCESAIENNSPEQLFRRHSASGDSGANTCSSVCPLTQSLLFGLWRHLGAWKAMNTRHASLLHSAQLTNCRSAPVIRFVQDPVLSYSYSAPMLLSAC